MDRWLVVLPGWFYIWRLIWQKGFTVNEEISGWIGKKSTKEVKKHTIELPANNVYHTGIDCKPEQFFKVQINEGGKVATCGEQQSCSIIRLNLSYDSGECSISKRNEL